MLQFGIWDAAVVSVKAATYATTLAAAGGVFFLRYSDSLLDGECVGRIRRLIVTLLFAAAFAGGAMILATAASMSGDAGGLVDGALAGMILQGGEGRASLARVAGLILIGVGLMGGGSAMGEGLALRRPPPLLALLGAVLAATSFAWVGHVHSLGAGAPRPWLPVLTIGVHLLGVAFWLGALGPLLLVANHTPIPGVAAVVRRFGAAALAVVAMLLAAGAGLLCQLLRGVSELWSDDYGRFVLTKLVLVAALLSLAAFNRLRLTPRLCAADGGALRALRRSIKAELAVAAGVLVVTAALTTLSGPAALEGP
jgi:putative copper resistance protein D